MEEIARQCEACQEESNRDGCIIQCIFCKETTKEDGEVDEGDITNETISLSVDSVTDGANGDGDDDSNGNASIQRCTIGNNKYVCASLSGDSNEIAFKHVDSFELHEDGTDIGYTLIACRFV